MRFLGPAARHLRAGGLLGLVLVLAPWVDPLGYFNVAQLKTLKEVPVKIYTVLDDAEPIRSAASPSQ